MRFAIVFFGSGGVWGILHPNSLRGGLPAPHEFQRERRDSLASIKARAQNVNKYFLMEFDFNKYFSELKKEAMTETARLKVIHDKAMNCFNILWVENGEWEKWNNLINYIRGLEWLEDKQGNNGNERRA